MSKAAQKIIDTCRANRNEAGVSQIAAKDVAVLVRDRLKREFPGVKFSVRSDSNSVDIYWTDGPTGSQVDAVAGEYKFGGFDGMIDLAYCKTNWILPDGSMQTAHCSGTRGSMGTVDAETSDCPAPGAVMVKYGPRYVFTHRSISDARMAELVKAAESRYGFQVPEGTSPHSYNVPKFGEYATTLAYRMERELAGT
jgi:hypothetical protein